MNILAGANCAHEVKVVLGGVINAPGEGVGGGDGGAGGGDGGDGEGGAGGGAGDGGGGEERVAPELAMETGLCTHRR